MLQNVFSEAFLERVPLYYDYLETYEELYISATILAHALNLGEVQVRKDLARISLGGKPKVGYEVSALKDDIKKFMKFDKDTHAIIVGMGQLGQAIYHYSGFKRYNIEIKGAFDKNGSYQDIKDLPNYCKENDVHVGIITVPKESAQEVADLLIASGVKALWNFAPQQLVVPNDVIVQNENIATSLSILIKHITHR